MNKELRDLLLRAIGAIENPADLTEEDMEALLEDLQIEADRLGSLGGHD